MAQPIPPRNVAGLQLRHAGNSSDSFGERFTQEQLGRRLGLKGRSVYREERDASAPRKRHQRELVVVINAINQTATTALATVSAAEAKARRGEVPVTPLPLRRHPQ